MSEAPERVWVSAEAVLDFAIDIRSECRKERDDYFPNEYIRADIAEAEKKAAVREFANRFTYEFDQRYKGNVALYELDKIHDLVTQLLNEATQ